VGCPAAPRRALTRAGARRASTVQANRAVSDPEDPVRFTSKMQLPIKAKPSVVQWLPFKDLETRGATMNKLMLLADVKGQLHIVDKEGSLIFSMPSGHSGAVTAMAVSKQHENECTVVTGGSQGDIRIHTMSRPPRHSLKPPLDPKNANSKKAVDWQPIVRLVGQFSPSSAEPLDGLGVAHFGADLQGAKPIASVQIIPRGKTSHNLLVSDAAGRLSVHTKNGSLIGSHELEPQGPIGGHAVSKTWTALSIDKQLALFDPRQRKIHSVCPANMPAALLPNSASPWRCVGRGCCRLTRGRVTGDLLQVPQGKRSPCAGTGAIRGRGYRGCGWQAQEKAGAAAGTAAKGRYEFHG